MALGSNLSCPPAIHILEGIAIICISSFDRSGPVAAGVAPGGMIAPVVSACAVAGIPAVAAFGIYRMLYVIYEVVVIDCIPGGE